ncbi:hypothetical protein IV500_13845 [Paeniglutamicibacter antarcticus]|uniref:STAS domain-containing protein n=1 Tax=Arthrobacter terrae TaxID=2935737 RepID=A0A931CS55_9MICC|nr:hypothetical protein [Arthrobacter terrae]MBG0740464.1 hypothetical protein [Arthrobacter terrae]
MDHKLRVIVRLDIEATSAVLEVNGCLTDKSCRALLPIIRRAGSLIQGLNVVVDLSLARHIDASALDILYHLNDGPDVDADLAPFGGSNPHVSVSAPAVLPECPAWQVSCPPTAAKVAA